MTTKTTRRSVLAGMAGGAVALPVMTTGIDPGGALPAGVQAVIADIRSLPGSTPYDVYVELQDVADTLDRLAKERAA